MDLCTVAVDPAEAEAKLAEYAGVLAKDRMAEDEAIAQAYRAAKRGMPLIRLSEAVAAGGVFGEGPSEGWPRIAVVRADAAECLVTYESNWRDGGGAWVFTDDERRRSYGALVGAHTVRAAVRQTPPGRRRFHRVRTMVPVIPPNVRPKRPRIGRFHVLWEVEEWSPAQPPVDPALLRHVRGDLWIVQAMWELTELERLVLGERAR